MSVLDRSPPLKRLVKIRIEILLPEDDAKYVTCEDIERMAVEDGQSLKEEDFERLQEYLLYMPDEELREKLRKIRKRKKQFAGVC